MNINLNVLNKIEEMEPTQVIAYQMPVNPEFNQKPIAWKVIDFKRLDELFQLTFEDRLKISIRDSGDNYSPFYPVSPGFRYTVSEPERGASYALNYEGTIDKEEEIHISNTLSRGAIDICCFRSGSMVSLWHDLVPGRTAIFQFKPSLYIAAVPEGAVKEGDALDLRNLNGEVSQLLLYGLSSVDAVLKSHDDGAYKVYFENHVTENTGEEDAVK